MLCYAESINGYFLVLPNVDLKLLLTDAKRQKKKACPDREKVSASGNFPPQFS